MPPEYDEQHRRELIRELQDKDRHLQAEVADFEAVVHQKRGEVSSQIDRLEAPFPPGNVCPYCWAMHGTSIEMRNHPEEPVQPMRDRFVCPRCLREEIRPA